MRRINTPVDIRSALSGKCDAFVECRIVLLTTKCRICGFDIFLLSFHTVGLSAHHPALLVVTTKHLLLYTFSCTESGLICVLPPQTRGERWVEDSGVVTESSEALRSVARAESHAHAPEPAPESESSPEPAPESEHESESMPQPEPEPQPQPQPVPDRRRRQSRRWNKRSS